MSHVYCLLLLLLFLLFLLFLLDIYRSEVITGTRVSGAYDPAVCGGGTVTYIRTYIHAPVMQMACSTDVQFTGSFN